MSSDIHIPDLFPEPICLDIVNIIAFYVHEENNHEPEPGTSRCQWCGFYWYNVSINPASYCGEKCQLCGQLLPAGHAFVYCNACSLEPRACPPNWTYAVSGRNIIYSGLPENPDIECLFQDLPMVREHPEPAWYQNVPVNVIDAQIHLISKRGKVYHCFVCAKQHSVPPVDPRHGVLGPLYGFQ